MTYTAELSQVGRKGTTVLATSFGLSLQVDYLISPQVKDTRYGRRVVGKPRHRVIRPMSLCCSAALTHAQNNPRAPLTCHVCRKAPAWPAELLDFSLSEDYSTGVSQLEELVEELLPDVLECTIATSGLWQLIEEVFNAVASGKRVSEFVTLKPRAEV